jgi:serine/threonine protein kinase
MSDNGDRRPSLQVRVPVITTEGLDEDANSSPPTTHDFSPESDRTLVTPITSPISWTTDALLPPWHEEERDDDVRWCRIKNVGFEGEIVGKGSFCKVIKQSAVYAVKIPLYETSVDMLFHEAKILTSIGSGARGIEKFHGMVTSGKKYGIVMDYYPFTLSTYLATLNPLTTTTWNNFVGEKLWLSWAIQLCQGLKTLQDHEIVHCDIKSANVFLDAHLNAYLGDFSSAHTTAELAISDDTQSMLAYSINFSAPELLSKLHAIPTFASDIYSLGLVLFHAATGNEPYSLATKNVSQKLIWAQRGYALTYCSDEDISRSKSVLPHLERFITQRQQIDRIIDALTQASKV